MTISPPTLTGFNNNVRYRGMRFHIQTEDSGITRPHITTLLFADGGYVIKSLRTDYAEYVGHPERAVLVHRLMRDQHRAMALDLRDGKLDATIDRIAPAPADADQASSLSELPISTPPPPLSASSPPANGAAPASASLGEASPPQDEVPAALDHTSVTVKSGTLVATPEQQAASEPAAVEPAPAEAQAPSERSGDEATLRPPSEPLPLVARKVSRSAAEHAGPIAAAPTDGEPVAEAAPEDEPQSAGRAASRTPSSRTPSSRTPSSRAPRSRADATERPPSSRKPKSSAHPPSTRASAASLRPATNAKGATRHRVISVGEAPASKTTPAEAAHRGSTTRRPSGSRTAAPSTQRPPSTQKSPSSRTATAQPDANDAATQRPPSSRKPQSDESGAGSQRPASSRKPQSSGRGANRPAFTAAALSPSSSKVSATTRAARNGSADARATTRQLPPSSRPPSSRGTAASSKRSRPPASAQPAPSSRRAGRPSPALTPAKGSKSLFGGLPQESLDDALRTYATTVKNGPPTRGSK
ncbi:MAG TPA: hypothetical protein VMG12_10990 [Polyangiaceae bacterium]|nr:hypothetical protein [Polyangiaceae bacterium]